MENNNQPIHHRDGDEFARISAKHKKFVEKDYPIALTEFRIANLKQQIAIKESLEILKKESERLENLQKLLNKHKPVKKYEIDLSGHRGSGAESNLPPEYGAGYSNSDDL